MENLKGIRVGDKVWSLQNGWDTVKSIDSEEGGNPYPIELDVGGNYSMDGKYYDSDKNPSLFFDIPEFFKEEIYPERPKYRAKIDSFYYFITKTGRVDSQREANDSEDDKLFRVGNYFETKEEAMESKLYKVFHEEGE